MTVPTRVLIIDDEPAIYRFLKPALEANDYQTISAGTAADGLRRIAADAPDVVVLDLGLPDMDGKDVIVRVREWSDVPIIVLSARDREAEKIAALDLGADDFVKARMTSSTSRSAWGNSWRACGRPCVTACSARARRLSSAWEDWKSTFPGGGSPGRGRR
jgi:CheY-like chemotaxis protein